MITDVTDNEFMQVGLRQGICIPGVSQLVEIDDSASCGHLSTHEAATNETRSTGDQNAVHVIHLSLNLSISVGNAVRHLPAPHSHLQSFTNR